MIPRAALPGYALRLVLAGLALVAVYLPLTPLGTQPAPFVPDLLFCLVAATIVRRPAAMPAWLVLGVGLFADLMLSRPPGLGALALIAASEAIRANGPVLRSLPFLIEWVVAVAFAAAMLVAMVAALRLTFAPVPETVALLRHLGATAMAYPVVAVLLTVGLGLRAPARVPPMRLGRLP